MINKEKLFKDINLLLFHPDCEKALYHKVEELKFLTHDDISRILNIRSKATCDKDFPADRIIYFDLVRNGENWLTSCVESIPQYIIDSIFELSAENESLLSHPITSPQGTVARISFTVDSYNLIRCSLKLNETIMDLEEPELNHLKITGKVEAELLDILDFCIKNPDFREYLIKKIGHKWKPFVQNNVISG